MNRFWYRSVAVLFLTVFGLGMRESAAQTAWLNSPATSDVNTATNWSAGLPSATVDAQFGTSTVTSPTQSAAITIRDMIFQSGASAFNYQITAGQLTLLNPATVAATQAPNVIENNSTTTQVIGNTTGAGGAMGISGTINAAAGDIVINGAINVGNNATNVLNYVALSGSHDVYFNVDPSINPAGNLSGGAWTSSLTTDMYRRLRGRFFLGQNFSGRAYFGDIGTTYQGAIHINSTANGALRLTNNNSLGNNDTTNAFATGFDIYGGTTNNGTLEFAPATGSGISVAKTHIWLDGRSGAVADDPHILNVSGNNTLTVTSEWNTGVRQPFGTTSEATSNNPFNAGNWNIQSDAGTFTIAGAASASNGVMYNIRNVPITLQLMGGSDGVISAPINKYGTNPTIGIVKKGVGTWTLTNANTDADGADLGVDYDGNVTVQEGTLALSGAGSLANAPSIDIRNNAKFDVTAVNGGIYSLSTLNASNVTAKGAGTIVGTVTSGGGAFIAPGDSGIGIMKVTGSLSLTGGATLNLELANTAGNNDKIAVTGNLSLAGTTEVPVNLVNGNLGVGTYTLLSYTGTLSGDANNLNITGLPNSSRQSFTKVTNTLSKQLNLVVAGAAANLTWVGGVNGNVWADGQAVPNSINWTGHPTDNHFFDGDSVTFDSSGTTFTPNVSGTVNPGSITFANNVGANYTISGGTIVAANLAYTGSGDANIASSNFTVTGNLTKGGTGKLTFSNSGATLAMPASVAVNSGTLAINRTDDFTSSSALATNFTGGGTVLKQNSNTIEITGDNSGLTGTMTVEAGTLATRSSTALANNTIVQSGATLDLGNNGDPSLGSSTKAVTISGTGVGGLGALTVTTPGNANGNNAHIGSLTLAGNSTIRVKSPAVGQTNRTILWSEGHIVGNGNALTVISDGSLGTTEVDLTNGGVTNLGNVNLLGNAETYVGGTTDLGSSGTLTLGGVVDSTNVVGRLGIYGNLYIAGEPVSITKPIVVAGLGGGLHLYRQSTTAYTISSPFMLNADLDVSLTNSASNTTNTLDLTGQLSGPGNLTVHTVASNTLRPGVINLVSDSNNFTGTTTIGGGIGLNGANPANDRITLSIGNGGSTGSIGGGAITIVAPTAATTATFQLNRTGTYTVPNSISFNNLGSGTAEVRAVGAGMATLTGPISGPGNVVVNSVGGGLTLTGTNSYSGNTTVTSGTLLINGDHSGIFSDVTVEANGIVGGTGTIGGSLIMAIDGSQFTTAFSGGTINPFDIVGNIDLSAAINSLSVSGVGTGTNWVIANYAGSLTGTFENVAPGYSVSYGTGFNSSITLNFVGIPGDYNNDTKVNAADYVIWRKNPGAHGGAAGYDVWRANFGVGGSGSGSSLGGSASVPEPGTLSLFVSSLVGLMYLRRKR